MKGAFAGALNFTADKANIKAQNAQFKDREMTEEPLCKEDSQLTFLQDQWFIISDDRSQPRTTAGMQEHDTLFWCKDTRPGMIWTANTVINHRENNEGDTDLMSK